MANVYYTKNNKQDSMRLFTKTELDTALANGDIFDIPDATINITACSIGNTEYYARAVDAAYAQKASTGALDTINTTAISKHFASGAGQETRVFGLGGIDISKYEKGSIILIKGKVNVTMHKITHTIGGGWSDSLGGYKPTTTVESGGGPGSGATTRLVVLAEKSDHRRYVFGERTFRYSQSGSPTEYYYVREGDADDYYNIFEQIVGGACAESGKAGGAWQAHRDNPNLTSVNQVVYFCMGDKGTHTLNINIKFVKDEENFLTLLCNFHAWKGFFGENDGTNHSSISAGTLSTNYALGEKTDLHFTKGGKEYIYLK